MIESSAGSMKQGGWKFSVLMAAAALVQGLFWAVLVPPWQAPDEPSHFAYVQHLYESGTWTPPGRGRPFSMELTRSLRLLHADEIHHDPNCTFAFTPEESRSVKAAVSRPPPASRTLPGEGENGAGHYPPLYYWAGKAGYGVFAKEDVVHRLFGVRLVSVLFFALAVFFSALAVRELAGGDGPTARTAACFVLLLPMHGFIGSSANCDALLFSVSALLVLACARLLRRGGGWRVHLGIAAVIALGCITKPTFVPMAILWPLAALPHLFVRDEGTKEARRRRVTTLVFMGAALALLLFLYLRFGRIYIRFFEDSFARSATQENRSLTAYLTRTLLDLARPWTKTGKRFYGSYFADFGWMDTSFPFAVYLLLVGGAAVSGTWLGRNILPETQRPSRIPWWLWGGTATAACTGRAVQALLGG